MGIGVESNPPRHGFASMMTYDADDNLENVMKHLSGGAALSGLPQNKLNPIQWSMRPVMRVMEATIPKP